MNLYQDIVKTWFVDNWCNPYALTQGQSDIFRIVYKPSILRGIIRAVTQYGKSDVCSMALVSTVCERKEKVLLVAPSIKQTAIIMNYVIGHLFDHPYLTSMLDIDTSLERLKRERSKDRITFKTDSEIFILTADAETVKKEAKNLMGFGASIIIVDESGLIPDLMFSKIVRMVGGQILDKKDVGKLVQLGNPFDRNNHFYHAFNDQFYEKLIIKKGQAMAEGRLTQHFLDEAKKYTTPLDYIIFYECEFPPVGAENSLFNYNYLQMAINNNKAIGGEKRAGLDIARFGRDKSVYIMREGNIVKRIETLEHADTMKVVGWVRGLLDEDKCPLNLDVVGLGAGVYDRLAELEKYDITPINVGEAPTTEEDKKKYFNLRAEMFDNLREQFIPQSGVSITSIPNNEELLQELMATTYGYSSERKIKIESKDDIKKILGRSPDKADALALAFFSPTIIKPELIIL